MWPQSPQGDATDGPVSLIPRFLENPSTQNVSTSPSSAACHDACNTLLLLKMSLQAASITQQPAQHFMFSSALALTEPLGGKHCSHPVLHTCANLSVRTCCNCPGGFQGLLGCCLHKHHRYVQTSSTRPCAVVLGTWGDWSSQES